jgi:hypothetical protein
MSPQPRAQTLRMLTPAMRGVVERMMTAYQDIASHQRFAEGPVLDKPLIDWFFAQYIDRQDRAALCAAAGRGCARCRPGLDRPGRM